VGGGVVGDRRAAATSPESRGAAGRTRIWRGAAARGGPGGDAKARCAAPWSAAAGGAVRAVARARRSARPCGRNQRLRSSLSRRPEGPQGALVLTGSSSMRGPGRSTGLCSREHLLRGQAPWRQFAEHRRTPQASIRTLEGSSVSRCRLRSVRSGAAIYSTASKAEKISQSPGSGGESSVTENRLSAWPRRVRGRKDRRGQLTVAGRPLALRSGS